jgi:hypothetical protein
VSYWPVCVSVRIKHLGCCWTHLHDIIYIYRLIHKSLRDFRHLWFSSRDGHTEGEHVNRGRDIPSFCPTLQVLNSSFLLSVLVAEQQSSEVLEGLTNYPIYILKSVDHIEAGVRSDIIYISSC